MTTLNKMQLAKDIYEIVNAVDYTPTKSIRADFIERLVIEAEMTKSGASTYYQNLRNKANGRGLYEYNKTAGKKSITEKKVKIEVDPRLDINVELIEVDTQVEVEPNVEQVAEVEMKQSVLDEVMDSVEAQTSTDEEPTQSVIDQVMDSVEEVAPELEPKPQPKAKAKPKRVDVKANANVDVVDVQGSAPKNQQMRWGVEQDGKMVDMFKTRTAARKFIEEHGGNVVDHGA